MVVKKYVIGLARYGCANRPFYHIAAMKRKVVPKAPVDERVIEQIGSFDPLPNKHNEKMVAINYERLRYWLSQDAKPSNAVGQLLGKVASKDHLIMRLGNGSPNATNVVVLLGVVTRFSIPYGSVISQLIVMKLFTHINDNILHQATVADF